MRFPWWFRVGLALGLSLVPVTAAAVCVGPSPALFAAFGSGVLWSVCIVALGEKEKP